MGWEVVGLVLLAALLVPLAAFVLDATRRRHGAPPPPEVPSDDRVELLANRFRQLEDDVEDLARNLEGLQDEVIDLQRQIDAAPRPPSPRPPHGTE